MKHPPTDHDDRINQLASIAHDAQSDQTARRQLADAALIFGLIHSDRLDPVLLYTIERIKEVSADAMRELTHAIERENRRRCHAPPPPSTTTPPE